MKILFCNITNMIYYRGVKPYDTPYGGGSYVEQHYDGSDVNNFKQAKDGTVHGFVMTRSLRKASREFAQIRLEKIEPGLPKDADSVEHVLVVWVTPDRMVRNRSIIVGWYKDAKVFRHFRQGEDDNYYNVMARPEDVVLLPPQQRQWEVPRASREGAGTGMGQSNVWYADKPEVVDFVLDMLKKIESYDGENWLDKDIEAEEVIRT